MNAMNRASTEETLNKAYRLAYFLHQDKALAVRIVAAATLKLNVAMAVQSKRLYYVPVGRFSHGESRRTDGIRNKALFSDLHLLQRLVYGESEPYERQKERAAVAGPQGVHADGDPASEADLLVYFIKHLVRITTKRNAFYVTLGASRLLHNYSTLETMEIYNAVIGEPERVKDDYYYRSRKAVLMHEMYQRFGQLIRASRQQRGEERFETQPGTSELRLLVRECLRWFTPWDTRCPVPLDFDPFKSIIASLASKNGANESDVEVSRIHAILHPDCFARLIAAFGYRTPAERMELPRFFLDQANDQLPPQQRAAPADLNAEELAEISHLLDEQAGRRRRSSPTAAIRIMIDGVERCRLNPLEQSSVSFSTEENAELIEVKTTDQQGDLLLATHLLTSGVNAHDAASVFSIRLEGGQELSLSITRRTTEANADAGLLVKFAYRETNRRRAARLWWQRHGLRLNPWQGGVLWADARIYIFAGSVAVIGVLTFLAITRLGSRQTIAPVPTEVVEANPANSSEPEKPITQSTPAVKPKHSTAKPAPAPRANVPPPPARGEAADVDVTRSVAAVPNLKLSEVKKIYLEIRGAGADELRKKFVERLGSSGVLAIASNADDADAALKIVVSQTGSRIEASAQLVNARGTVLWPKGGARHYSGDIVSGVVNDLSSMIRSSH